MSLDFDTQFDPAYGEAIELAPGDGFVLPPGTRHSALVGPSGCTCLEGHRR
jgi:quercetin dioxygenase-like cupin family protein